MKAPSRTDLRELLKRRQECLAAYNRWQAAHREKLSAAQAIRRISEIYDMFLEWSKRAKKKDRAAKIDGIRKMRQALSVLGSTTS